jgi:hypothetical protein
VARCLDRADEPYGGSDSYFAWLKDMYLRKRDELVSLLRDAGLKPMVPGSMPRHRKRVPLCESVTPTWTRAVQRAASL